MTDKDTAADDAAETTAAKVKKASPATPETRNGEIVRDFGTYADAVAQAAIIGGTVEAIGTAYHVHDAE